MFESVDQIVNLVETDPCASAVSLVTLVNLLGYYPVPIRIIFKMIFQYDQRQLEMHLKIISSSAEQEKILLEVTQVIATKWEDTMDMELSDIQGMDLYD